MTVPAHRPGRATRRRLGIASTTADLGDVIEPGARELRGFGAGARQYGEPTDRMPWRPARGPHNPVMTRGPSCSALAAAAAIRAAASACPASSSRSAKFKLKLLQQHAALGGLAEALVALVNLSFSISTAAVLRFALRRQPCGALGHEHRLQRRDIIGQRIINAHRRFEI
jgi:hypothetical protein